MLKPNITCIRNELTWWNTTAMDKIKSQQLLNGQIHACIQWDNYSLHAVQERFEKHELMCLEVLIILISSGKICLCTDPLKEHKIAQDGTQDQQ